MLNFMNKTISPELIIQDSKFNRFFKMNTHYNRYIKKYPISLVKIFYNGLTHHTKFTLDSLIRYYMIFVTK
jgi:hypothetical protein